MAPRRSLHIGSPAIAPNPLTPRSPRSGEAAEVPDGAGQALIGAQIGVEVQFFVLSTRALLLIQGIMPRSFSPTSSIW